MVGTLARRRLSPLLRRRFFFCAAPGAFTGSGLRGSASTLIGRSSHRLVSLQRLTEKAPGGNGFSLSKRSVDATGIGGSSGSNQMLEEEKEAARRPLDAGYFWAGLGLAALFLGTGLMLPMGRSEEISMSSLKTTANELSRRIAISLEALADKLSTTIEEVLDAGSTALVLLQCLKSVLESYGEGVTKGWWRAKVAAFLADVSAAGGDRRLATVSAGDGVVVDWLLETAAKTQGVGSVVTQGEAARALSYLLEDEATCESVLARPRSLPYLLRFSASLPVNLRPRAYKHRKKLSDVGSSRGKSQLVAAIMEIVTASCEADGKNDFRPRLPGTADPEDISAALAVVEEGGSMMADDPRDDDDDRGNAQGIGLKVLGGTGLVALHEGPLFRLMLNSRDKLQEPVVTLALADRRNQDKDLVAYGLWDDLQGRFVAVPLAAWAVATWAEASSANRAHIVRLDKDGEALMAAVLAPERTVRWHGARTMRLLLENSKTTPSDEVVLQWSSVLLDLVVQACSQEDSYLADSALAAFTACFKDGRLAHLPALQKAFPVMRGLAQQFADDANIQKAIARAVHISIESGLQLPPEESKNWSGILLRWASSRQFDKTTQASGSKVLAKIMETLGETSIPISQTFLALLLLDLVKHGKPESKSPVTANKEAKAKGLLQSQVLQAASVAASNLGRVVALEAKAEAAVSDVAAGLPLADLLGADYAPTVVAKNGAKEQLPKVSVTDAATMLSKGVKALTDLVAEDQALQKRIVDAGGLRLLRRLMLSDDYERWFSLEAITENDTRPQSVKDKEATEVKKLAAHIRKHAARLLTVLTQHRGVADTIADDNEWCTWLEDCAAGRIAGCSDLKSLSYAKMILLNIANSKQQVKGYGRELSDGVWPRYEDMIFLLSKAVEAVHVQKKHGSKEAEGADTEERPEKIVQRADGSSADTSPLLDVVFIHGLAGGPIKTWRIAEDKTSTTSKSGLIERIDEQAGREGTCWPYEWLSEDFPRSRLISFKYKTNFSEWSGATLPLEEVSSMLLDKLLAAGVGERPVVFIAHSMGGLVVKQMLLQASKDKARSHLVDQACGVVFYSCPHFGSRLADMPWRMGYVLRPAPSVAELRSGSPRLEELNRCVRNLHYRGTLEVLSFSETKVTPLVEGYGGWALRMEVVPIESAYPGFGELVVLDGTDHVNSCKPLSPADPAYTKTLEFLRKVEAKLEQRRK